MTGARREGARELNFEPEVAPSVLEYLLYACREGELPADGRRDRTPTETSTPHLPWPSFSSKMWIRPSWSTASRSCSRVRAGFSASRTPWAPLPLA